MMAESTLTLDKLTAAAEFLLFKHMRVENSSERARFRLSNARAHARSVREGAPSDLANHAYTSSNMKILKNLFWLSHLFLAVIVNQSSGFMARLKHLLPNFELPRSFLKKITCLFIIHIRFFNISQKKVFFKLKLPNDDLNPGPPI